MMKNKIRGGNGPHSCMQYEGKDRSCNSCKFKEAGVCETVIKSLRKGISYMKKFKFKLNEQDAENILNDFFYEIYKKYDHNRVVSRFSTSSFLSIKFKEVCYDYMRKKPNIGDIKYIIDDPPKNIEHLIKETNFSNYFKWDPELKELKLLRYPLPYGIVSEAKINADFSSSHGREEWNKNMENFYKNGRACRFVIDDTYYDKAEDKNEDIESKLDSFFEQSNMYKVFTHSKIWGEDDKLECMSLFALHLDVHDLDKHELAEIMGINRDQLKYRIEICYRRYRQTVVKILRQIDSDHGRFCREILKNLSVGLTDDIRDCLMMIFRKLEEGNV